MGKPRRRSADLFNYRNTIFAHAAKLAGVTAMSARGRARKGVARAAGIRIRTCRPVAAVPVVRRWFVDRRSLPRALPKSSWMRIGGLGVTDTVRWWQDWCRDARLVGSYLMVLASQQVNFYHAPEPRRKRLGRCCWREDPRVVAIIYAHGMASSPSFAFCTFSSARTPGLPCARAVLRAPRAPSAAWPAPPAARWKLTGRKEKYNGGRQAYPLRGPYSGAWNFRFRPGPRRLKKAIIGLNQKAHRTVVHGALRRQVVFLRARLISACALARSSSNSALANVWRNCIFTLFCPHARVVHGIIIVLDARRRCRPWITTAGIPIFMKRC